jgi:signal transduction histidine kinase
MTSSLCDCSLIYILEEDGSVKLASHACKDTPYAQRFSKLVERYPPSSRTQIGVLGVLEKRRSLVVTDVNEDIIQSLAQDTEHAHELHEILYSYMLVPMATEEKAIGVLGFMRCDPMERYDDIDRMTAEELGHLSALALENTRHSEKLRQAIQVREDVVAVVSHDLRNPLAVILQSCELISKQLMRLQAPDNVTRLAQIAKSASLRMHELISNLLDLSHLESGQFVLRCEKLDCVSFCRETVDLLLPLATQKGITLNLDQPADLPPAHADRTRLAQILNNLIGNAIKHTPTGGTIDVHLRLREDGWFEFVVSDNGCGIKEEYLPHLFNRYWKPMESKGGFGLGLFVAKGIIEAHGGSIHVSSEVNKGTSFTFTIPSCLVESPGKSTLRIDHAPPPA